MTDTAAITVNRSRDEAQRLWRSPEHLPHYTDSADATVTFKDAPGDRGTEIHVVLAREAGGLGAVVARFSGGETLSKVKDDLRRFKAQVETGVIPRSDGVPEGELAERKLKPRPAQPLPESELEKADVR